MPSVKAEIMSNFYYYNYYRNKRPIGYSNFKKKYFKYFEIIEDRYSHDETFDPKNYIYVNMLSGFLYPQQLTTNKCFLDSKNKVYTPSKEEKLYLAEQIVNGARRLNKKSVKEWLENKFNQMDLLDMKYEDTLKFLCFSKTFLDYLEKNKQMFNEPIDPSIQRCRILQYPKIVNKIKEILGDDYYASEESND